MSEAFVKRIELKDLLLHIIFALPFLGLFLGSSPIWLFSFLAALLWVLTTREAPKGGLSLLWGVRVEPAPCDLLFIGAWVMNLLQGKLRWLRSLALHLLLAFVFLNILQIPVSASLNRGAWFAGATLYVISLAFLFSTITESKQWHETRNAFLLAVWITAVIVLILALLGFLGWNGHIADLYYAGRPRGFFKDPNVAGPFVAVGTLFALSRLLFLRKRLMSFDGFLLLTSLLAVISTFSRGALLNLAAGVAVLWFISVRARKGLKFALALAIVAGISAVALPYLAEVFGQSFRFHGLTSYDIYGRFAAWRAGLLLAKDYPWGIGPGQFEIFAPKYQLELFSQVTITPSAHNTYLRVLVENGVTGLGVFLLALGSFFLSLMRNVGIAVKEGNRGLLADGAWLASALVGIMVESFVIDTLHWRHFWILVGFAVAYGRLTRER